MDYYDEEWKPVVGLESLYDVSSNGRIRTKRTRDRVPRLMKPFLDKHGYYRIVLRVNNQAHRRFLHHLVMEAFVGPRPQGYEVNHIDWTPANNRVSNLVYTTPYENYLHSMNSGKRMALVHYATLLKKSKIEPERAALVFALAATFCGLDLAELTV